MDVLTRSYLMLAVLILILIGLIAFIIKSSNEEKISKNNNVHSE
jgi:hypothetical protein